MNDIGNTVFWHKLSVLIFALCATVSPSTLPAREAPAAATTLRVLARDVPPFFHRDDQGALAGFEHLILQSFAEAHGMTLEVIWVAEFDQIFELLLEDHGDLIAGTITMTEERRRHMEFSTPYFPVRVVLVERKDAETAGLDALGGKRVVTVPGTTYETALSEVPRIEWIHVQSEEKMYEELAAGRADALATDSTNFLWFGNQYPGLVVTDALTDREFFGFAFGPGDPLRAALDEHLSLLQEDGRFWTFLEVSFGDLLQIPVCELKSDFFSP